MTPLSIAATAGVAIPAGITAWGAVDPASQFFGPVLRRTKASSEIALTFDDGPNPAITPALLDLLDRHNARATFFVIGKFTRACPAIVREIGARGHSIGNHTYSHPNLFWLPEKRIVKELLYCRESIAQAVGRDVAAWMRPPWGFRGPQLVGAVQRAGLHGVATWSLKCYDWRPQPIAQLIERLGRAGLPSKEGGHVVLLHDGDFRKLGADRHHVLTALKYWLPRWQDAGIKFVTIEDAAGDMADTA